MRAYPLFLFPFVVPCCNRVSYLSGLIKKQPKLRWRKIIVKVNNNNSIKDVYSFHMLPQHETVDYQRPGSIIAQFSSCWYKLLW